MKYHAQKTAEGLIKTALGESFYGKALHDALDFNCISEDEKRCVHRYIYGSNLKTDHVTLQDIAYKIMESKEFIK